MPWTTLALWCQLLAPNQTRGRADANSHGRSRYLKARFSDPCYRSIRRSAYSKTVAAIRAMRFFERLEPCLIGIEACGTSHHWARELLALGHQVKLMPPTYVKPYVRGNKNDAADAEAICEAVTRPTMRFVPFKGIQQQAVLAMHRVRSGSGTATHYDG